MHLTTARTALSIGLLLLVAGCAAPPADTPEARAELARAIARVQVEGGALEETLDLGTGMAYEASAGPLALEIGRDLTGDEREKVKSILRDALGQVLTRQKFEDAVADVYAAHFTAAELAEVDAFFRGATGLKLIRLNPQVTTEIGDATEAILEENLESFIESVDERLAQEFPALAQGGAS